MVTNQWRSNDFVVEMIRLIFNNKLLFTLKLIILHNITNKY